MPAASEGADGVLEGQGEGSGVPTAAPNPVVPAADEGVDGTAEGQGEGSAAPTESFPPIGTEDYDEEFGVHQRRTKFVVHTSSVQIIHTVLVDEHAAMQS
jgi:hypothetical protein